MAINPKEIRRLDALINSPTASADSSDALTQAIVHLSDATIDDLDTLRTLASVVSGQLKEIIEKLIACLQRAKDNGFRQGRLRWVGNSLQARGGSSRWVFDPV